MFSRFVATLLYCILTGSRPQKCERSYNFLEVKNLFEMEVDMGLYLKQSSRGLIPGGAPECNLTVRCPFLKNLHNPFRKKIYISIRCFGIIRLQKIPKNNRENNNLLFLNKEP